jgi:hypothetical protein
MSEYVNQPLSEADMQTKLDEVRANVGKKMDKWANRLQVSMAFTPKVQRVEGERWTENGKLWEMKGGIKMSITHSEQARMPWWCPKCSKPMNHRFDRKFYYLRGMCYNCNVDWEGQMRIDGTFAAFEKRMLRENEKAFLRDKIEEHLTYIKEFKEPTVHFENGPRHVCGATAGRGIHDCPHGSHRSRGTG